MWSFPQGLRFALYLRSLRAHEAIDARALSVGLPGGWRSVVSRFRAYACAVGDRRESQPDLCYGKTNSMQLIPYVVVACGLCPCR